MPPFEKEPAFEGKEIARGLIPTVPPTPLLRNITDRDTRNRPFFRIYQGPLKIASGSFGFG